MAQRHAWHVCGGASQPAATRAHASRRHHNNHRTYEECTLSAVRCCCCCHLLLLQQAASTQARNKDTRVHTVRVEASQAIHVGRVLAQQVEVLVVLDHTARRATGGGAHHGRQEAAYVFWGGGGDERGHEACRGGASRPRLYVRPLLTILD